MTFLFAVASNEIWLKSKSEIVDWKLRASWAWLWKFSRTKGLRLALKEMAGEVTYYQGNVDKTSKVCWMMQ